MILLTGGSGLLGTELQKYLDCETTRFDITQPVPQKFLRNWSLVIHAAAYTDVVKAEKDRKGCFLVNFMGTVNLAKTFRGIPFVHISTEYVYNPTNFYTLTKVEAEKAVVAFANPYLIIRTLFKSYPFPHPRAFVDQYTRGDYVDVIAPLIVSEIIRWDKKVSGARDVVTERKTMFELARRSNPEVEESWVDDIKEVRLPKDYK